MNGFASQSGIVIEKSTLMTQPPVCDEFRIENLECRISFYSSIAYHSSSVVCFPSSVIGPYLSFYYWANLHEFDEKRSDFDGIDRINLL